MKYVLVFFAMVVWGNAGKKPTRAYARYLEDQKKFESAFQVYYSLYKEAASRNEKVEHLQEMADCSLRSGDAARAVETYRTILTRFPEHTTQQLSALSRFKEGARLLGTKPQLLQPKESEPARALRKRLENTVIKKLELEDMPLDKALNKVAALAQEKGKPPLSFILLYNQRYRVCEKDLDKILTGIESKSRIVEYKEGNVLVLKRADYSRWEGGGGFTDDDDDDFGDDDDDFGDDDDDFGDDDDDFGDDDDDVKLPDDGKNKPKLPGITMCFDEIPLSNLLHYAAEQVNYNVEIRGRHIILLSHNYTTESFELAAYKVPAKLKLYNLKEFMDKMHVDYPTNTSGEQAFIACNDDGDDDDDADAEEADTFIMYNTRLNHKRVQGVLSAIQKSLNRYVSLSIQLVEVDAGGKSIPAFVTSTYLNKIPSSKKRVVDCVTIATKSGKETHTKIGNQRKHELRVKPTVSADLADIDLDLGWTFNAGEKIESKINSSFRVQVSKGRVLQLGMENGRYLLAVISAKVE